VKREPAPDPKKGDSSSGTSGGNYDGGYTGGGFGGSYGGGGSLGDLGGYGGPSFGGGSGSGEGDGDGSRSKGSRKDGGKSKPKPRKDRRPRLNGAPLADALESDTSGLTASGTPVFPGADGDSDSAPSTPVLLGGLGALAAGLVGGFFWYRRRLP